ncbi:hypothetical protein D9M68_889600 [compost metagenome]
MQRHDQRQPGVAVADEDASETQQRADRAKAHDGQALAAVIAQPAPDIRRDAAHQHGNGDQLADARGGKAQVIEIQRQKRHRGAEQREIEEIETGQTPVGNGGSHKRQAASDKVEADGKPLRLAPCLLGLKVALAPAY